MSAPASNPTVSVVIAAYTLDRWRLTRQAVESSRSQSHPVEKVVLCIDNNPQLLERARAEWGGASGVPVEVITNVGQEGPTGGSNAGSASARNTAVAAVDADVVAFLDDDARPETDWIARLMEVYEDPAVVAVGGAPLPDFETARPSWYPPSFDWVFGCVYTGLPDEVAPLLRLIGANMSVRRDALERVGGFGVDYPIDDLELCLKLSHEYGDRGLYYTPHAIVHHHVSSSRLSWAYFRDRCFTVSRQKAALYRRLGGAANLAPEREFVWRALREQVPAELGRGLRGDRNALVSLFVTFAGIGLAAAGRLAGWLDLATGRAGR